MGPGKPRSAHGKVARPKTRPRVKACAPEQALCLFVGNQVSGPAREIALLGHGTVDTGRNRAGAGSGFFRGGIAAKKDFSASSKKVQFIPPTALSLDETRVGHTAGQHVETRECGGDGAALVTAHRRPSLAARTSDSEPSDGKTSFAPRLQPAMTRKPATRAHHAWSKDMVCPSPVHMRPHRASQGLLALRREAPIGRAQPPGPALQHLLLPKGNSTRCRKMNA